jgi:hypothetical protein
MLRLGLLESFAASPNKKRDDLMYTFLALPSERQRLYYEEGSQKLGLVPASVEKDLWVCFILRELFSLSSWGQHLTFKDGTSLSKGWKLISREAMRDVMFFDDPPPFEEILAVIRQFQEEFNRL